MGLAREELEPATVGAPHGPAGTFPAVTLGAEQMQTKEAPFPLDWTEWEHAFNTWRRTYGLPPAREKIRGINFMADEVMGTYLVKPHHVVELSAVTFPNLSERDAATGRLIERTDRMVGITWLDPNAGPDDTPGINGGLVSTFAELEAALEAGPPVDA